jgi:hypothetical protein
MVNRLFPKVLDNHYQGQKLALWLLGLLVLVKAAMGLNSIFNGYHVATDADGIPLYSFTPAGARAVVAFLSVWGLEILLLSLLSLLALVRYRAMVPLMFLVLLMEQAGRKATFAALPIAKPVAAAGPPPAFSINLVICILLVVGIVLSLWPRKQAPGNPP